jgi:hypothetical protein
MAISPCEASLPGEAVGCLMRAEALTWRFRPVMRIHYRGHFSAGVVARNAFLAERARNV